MKPEDINVTIRKPGTMDYLFAKYRVKNPPLKTLDQIILEARDQHDDILTDDSWNLNYAINVSLTVRELRVLAEFIECLHLVHESANGLKRKERENEP